eukprot:1381967-Amorphochlora_amoeboformis.AAC.1
MFTKEVTNWQGDITLVPSLNVRDYVKLISDPGEELDRYYDEGKRLIWKKVWQIEKTKLVYYVFIYT